MKEQIEKAIFYFQKAGPNSGLGSAYMAYGIFMSLTNDLEIGIDYLKKAISEFGQNNSKRSELIALIELSGFYSRSGDFENGLVYGKKTVQVAESILKLKDAGDADSLRVGQSYYWMGKFYSIAGDYETAFSYMRKARYFYPDEAGFLNPWTIAMGDLYLSTEKYDSAMYYLKSFENKTQGRPILSKLYIALKQYDKALGLLNEEIKVASNRNNQSGLGSIYIIAAKAYFGKNDYVTALKNANEGITLLKKIKSSAAMIGAYNLLSRIYNELGKNDSAYFYLRQSTVLKDSLLNRQFFIRLNDLKKEAEEERKTSQINLLNKDNQLKEQKLKQQATLRNSLIIGILLLFLLGVFVFRTLLLKRKNDKLRMQKDLELQQLENQKKQAELHQRAVELEMQALRAQMNPHFIFNCLSSINRFIFKNDNKTASDYLTRFSRLIRMVLMHSQKKLIPLEDELEMIRLYLDLERLRFKDAFDYSITTTNIVDPGTVFIPPIILQPFCENAVWHGLMHKENKGHLNIVISEVINENDKTLHCIIEDDGVGREKAAEMKSKSAGKEKSLGLKITTERIALLNKENNFNTFYKIDDILNDEHEVAGTRVQLKIKHKESVEEYT
jgi:tetratricopeptide (TPR) repeat protein